MTNPDREFETVYDGRNTLVLLGFALGGLAFSLYLYVQTFVNPLIGVGPPESFLNNLVTGLLLIIAIGCFIGFIIIFPYKTELRYNQRTGEIIIREYTDVFFKKDYSETIHKGDVLIMRPDEIKPDSRSETIYVKTKKDKRELLLNIGFWDRKVKKILQKDFDITFLNWEDYKASKT